MVEFLTNFKRTGLDIVWNRLKFVSAIKISRGLLMRLCKTSSLLAVRWETGGSCMQLFQVNVLMVQDEQFKLQNNELKIHTKYDCDTMVSGHV